MIINIKQSYTTHGNQYVPETSYLLSELDNIWRVPVRFIDAVDTRCDAIDVHLKSSEKEKNNIISARLLCGNRHQNLIIASTVRVDRFYYIKCSIEST